MLRSSWAIASVVPMLMTSEHLTAPPPPPLGDPPLRPAVQVLALAVGDVLVSSSAGAAAVGALQAGVGKQLDVAPHGLQRHRELLASASTVIDALAQLVEEQASARIGVIAIRIRQGAGAGAARRHRHGGIRACALADRRPKRKEKIENVENELSMDRGPSGKQAGEGT
jgi:hypothetical protein